MSNRLIGALVAAGAMLFCAFGIGFGTPVAASTGSLLFVVGVISCALLGAGLGTVPRAIAFRSARERREQAGTHDFSASTE
jgi:hypothetical protein